MFAIASGKNGVGKTWFAITLSHAFAGLGQRTLLIDTHTSMAHVGVQLGIGGRNNLGTVLSGGGSLVDAIAPYREGGFDVVMGRPTVAPLRPFPAERMDDVAQQVRGATARYDIVVMDMATRPERANDRLLACAGPIIVVVNSDPTAIRSGYRYIQSILDLDPQADPRVLVNGVDGPKEGYRCYEALRRTCADQLDSSPSLAGVIRADRNVSRAIQNQVPLLSRYPGSDAAVDVDLVAATMLR